MACTLLADLGAEVVRIERPGSNDTPKTRGAAAAYDRGRRHVKLDLRDAGALATALDLVAAADVLIEGMRPGVMERLGLAPDVCLARNPRLIYGRMTGWGQTGPRAQQAGHDINYLGLTGALHAMGPSVGTPSPPLNLVADYGGGAMFLAFGIAAALFERERSDAGQVVDAAMVDGVAILSGVFHALLAEGEWTLDREANVLDGGAHYYRVYATADDRFIAVGAIEPKFYGQLLERLRLDPKDWPQHDRNRWPELRQKLAEIFASRGLDEWVALFNGADACVTPVNTFREATSDPHLVARGTFSDELGFAQPSPAPRFSRTPGKISGHY